MSIETIKLLTSLAKPLTIFGVRKMLKLDAIQQFRIEQTLERSFAEVWSDVGAYLTAEGITEAQQHTMALSCITELKPFAENPQYLIDHSLDGDKLFEHLRKESPFPQAVSDEKLEAAYQIIFPLVASVLCRSTVIVEQLRDMEFAEILARFDALKQQLGVVLNGIKHIQQGTTQRADQLFNRVLQQSLKKVLLGVEITGLYGESSIKNAKEEMFILPAIREYRNDEGPQKRREVKEIQTATTTESHVDLFLNFDRRSIVRGSPGAGKSTWSKWIQAQSIRDCNILSLYVKLRSYAGRDLPTVAELIHEIVGPNMALEIKEDSIKKWIDSGRIGLILDGFDEISPSQRRDVISQIIDISDYITPGPCILTSRPLNSDHLEAMTPSWTQWSILSFDKTRIIEYITKWYKYAQLKEGAIRDVDAQALYADLTKDPHISPLTGNPLMLATLLMVHHNDGELPKGRSRLYARYIDGMLGIWDDRQEIKVDTTGLEREQKKRILTSLAISLHLGNIDELAEAATLDVIRQAIQEYNYKTDAQLVLDSLRERSGLIVGPGSYSFTHKSVGEYLVAQAICDGDRDYEGETLDRFQLNRERNNDRWLNVLYFWAGSTPVGDLQTFIQGMDRSDSCGLILGLLWDQMDRFKKDWLRPQVMGCLEYIKNSPATPESSFNYYGWSFSDDIKGCHKSITQGFYPPIKHISLNSFDTGPSFKDLQVKIDFNFDDLSAFESSISLYNACVGFFLDPSITINYFDNFDKIEKWPNWLKKSQFACILIFDLLTDIGVDAESIWEKKWGNKKDAALWLAAALVTAVPDRLNASNFWNADNVSGVLGKILALEWSDECLLLSHQWRHASDDDADDKADASGDNTLEDTDDAANERGLDFFDQLDDMLDKIRAEKSLDAEKISRIDSSYKFLVERRLNLDELNHL